MKIFLLYIFMFAGLLVTALSTSCNDVEIQKRCLIYPISEDSNVLNAEEKWCKAFIPTIECLIQEAERCPGSSNAKRINEHRKGREEAYKLCSKFQNLKLQRLQTVATLKSKVRVWQ
uniref:U78-Liphistoxin-Lth1a_1 n=1 Tax=Liphistius thaleban TaxID=1905330 RepID=A0A4Q8K3E8_9ARAC